ncbi:hypothetical protein AGDE_12671 [Angomonas deanei]|uniref:Galactose oxidase, central domain/Kelch motif containing protein, putative n=1 Tax=Angomonas deanei TaxID=59799 RepID=A0A7G2C5H0_9TRYP|nr:hypothetical protein AGDE_12671 [Angomonas deanei]CAD2214986.1 Galactose oxidase, central domain/Kelch motif containing protein, putative [Angomonas deanei]|eukprot:EPY23873.1 hypothetical protein AGDE_12671 [Angomonas deanei]
MTIVEPLDKLVLIGGIGPGGILSVDKTVMEDPLRAARSNYLLPVGCRTNQSAERQLSNGYPTTRENNTATGIGFVPYLFDMTLSTQAWRAVQTSVVFPLVYHTAVSFGTQVYVFGGLSETLEVQDNLIVVNVEDYSVRRVLPRGKEEKPCGRFLHSAVRFGLYMIIYGGLNEKNEVLNDAWAFDMVNSRWEKLPFSAEVGGRAGHAAVVVGSRMLIYGGFDTSLEETNISNPLSAVAEINLVPTTKGEHVYKESIRIKPKVAPCCFFHRRTVWGRRLLLFIWWSCGRGQEEDQGRQKVPISVHYKGEERQPRGRRGRQRRKQVQRGCPASKVPVVRRLLGRLLQTEGHQEERRGRRGRAASQ